MLLGQTTWNFFPLNYKLLIQNSVLNQYNHQAYLPSYLGANLAPLASSATQLFASLAFASLAAWSARASSIPWFRAQKLALQPRNHKFLRSSRSVETQRASTYQRREGERDRESKCEFFVFEQNMNGSRRPDAVIYRGRATSATGHRFVRSACGYIQLNFHCS